MGYFTKLLTDECAESKITGMDISPNAISRGGKMFPTLSFRTGNANDLGKSISLTGIDCIILSEIMWYILADAKTIISTLKENYHGILIINQVFYYGGQEYGKDAYTNEIEMASYLGLTPSISNKYQKRDVPDAYETHNVFQL